MHLANLRSCSTIAGSAAGPSAPPLDGMYCWQAACAVLNDAEFGSMSAPCSMIPPPGFGSAMSTPWSRIHCVYFRAAVAKSAAVVAVADGLAPLEPFALGRAGLADDEQ